MEDRLGVLENSDRKVYELLTKQRTTRQSCQEYHKSTFDALEAEDKEVYELITKEHNRLCTTLQLIAAENQCSKAVLAALGSIVQNKTTEGFAGARFHGGCEIVDALESLTVSRAKEAFGAQYANVQPHSGTQANQIVLTAMLCRDDKILSMALDQGGHLSHGAKISFTGRFFNVENYHVDKDTFLLNYETVREKAHKIKPKLIICGATAYSRTIDFDRFRKIADEVGAYLLADISHIAGLVIAGAHRSPINHAHFTTTSTYKPGGPRGGLILIGKDCNRSVRVAGKDVPLWKHIQKATFPGVQGTPCLNNIAAKAVFFKEALCEEYRVRQFRIIENAKKLADSFLNLGYDVLTGRTDNHMLLMNVTKFRQGLTGLIAQNSLEQCGIVVNMNKLPYDDKPATVTSGIRLGTHIITRNGMGAEEMDTISMLVDSVLRKVQITNDTEYTIDEAFANKTRNQVEHLCHRFGAR